MEESLTLATLPADIIREIIRDEKRPELIDYMRLVRSIIEFDLYRWYFSDLSSVEWFSVWAAE